MKVGRSNRNKEYALCFFSLMGAVIGALMYAFCMACLHYGFGQSCFALVGAVIPVILSGGVYLAGFMNTFEILSSDWTGDKSGKEKKEPPKVVRSGNFAAIAMGIYFWLYAGGLLLIWKERQLLLLGMGYIVSRTLYGMALVWFPSASGENMSYASLSLAQKKALRVILSIILALCFCTCIAISPIMGVLEALLCMWIWTYYYYMSKKRFGGITRDAAGYFLTLCELASVLFVGMFGRVLL